MKPRGRWAWSLALLGLLALAGCASEEELDCYEPPDPCPDSVVSCDSPPDACGSIPPGVTHALVLIDSSPTPAAIYIDGKLAGVTPLRQPLYFSDETRFVSVVADPLYPNQSRQERRVRVPPVPDRIQFFMNTPVVDEGREGKSN